MPPSSPRQVRGKDFRHEKTKKKRGSYKGGAIDPQATFSKKFDSGERVWARGRVWATEGVWRGTRACGGGEVWGRGGVGVPAAHALWLTALGPTFAPCCCRR